MTQLPLDSRAAAETIPSRRRHHLSRRRRALELSVPYMLILPTLLAIGALLGYPIYKLITMSLQDYDRIEVVARYLKPSWVGFQHFSFVLHDRLFWQVLERSAIFTVANVGLTIIGGTLIALLLLRVSTWVRLVLTSGLVLVWAMPAVVAVEVWLWMTQPDNAILTNIFSKLHLVSYGHDWQATPFQALSVVTAVIVWGAIPFIVVTVYAGLSQVPAELVEASRVDGARSWQTWRDVTFPILRPVLLIVTSLSIIWDFGVFTQAYLVIQQEQLIPANYIMGTYLFEVGTSNHRIATGSAICLLMFVIVAIMSIFYVRKMVQIGDVQ